MLQNLFLDKRNNGIIACELNPNKSFEFKHLECVNLNLQRQLIIRISNKLRQTIAIVSTQLNIISLNRKIDQMCICIISDEDSVCIDLSDAYIYDIIKIIYFI